MQAYQKFAAHIVFRDDGGNEGQNAPQRGKRLLHGGSGEAETRVGDGRRDDFVTCPHFETCSPANFNTRYFGSALLETGSETTSSYLQSLILALVAYPEAQRKAHEEIDRVVGGDRLPTLDDLKHLPYIRAMISEVG